MLHVSLHAGPLSSAAFNTLIGFADIASSKAAALQDHQAVFRTAREQPGPLLAIQRYPRYAVSCLDLVARFITLHLQEREHYAARESLEREHAALCQHAAATGATPPPPPNLKPLKAVESLLPYDRAARRPPYARRMCAVVDQVANAVNERTERLCTVEFTCRDGRGTYDVRVDEAGFAPVAFELSHRPARLVHWRLLMVAICWHLTGTETLPPRPRPSVPATVQLGGETVVRMADVTQPQRAMLYRWLVRHHHVADIEAEQTTEARFLEFLYERR